jgi:RNA polymerase sigma-70 factor, ECF subfamily
VQNPLTLKAIYESEFRFVWRSLARLGVPSADIADAAQEVFMVVHRRLPEFDQGCKVSTWLYRICFNVASDRRRRAHVRREVPSEDTFIDHNAASEPRATDDLALFDWLVSGMELEQRAVFVLFEVEGYSGQEIADMMDCPLPTVYSRLRLARAAFARAAERYRASESHSLREAAL